MATDQFSETLRERYKARQQRKAAEWGTRTKKEVSPRTDKPRRQKREKKASPPFRSPKTRTCTECGGIFVPRSGERYCPKDICQEAKREEVRQGKRDAYERWKAKRPPKPMVVCPHCKEEFERVRIDQVYCSKHECQNFRRAERQRESRARRKMEKKS